MKMQQQKPNQQQAPSYFICPKFEMDLMETTNACMMMPAAIPQKITQLERLEKDLEQAKQKLLVLRAQGHQESLQSENRVKFSQQRVSESRYWTNEERQRFKKALKTFGTDFTAIAKFVGTRSSTQVRTHAQKYYAKLIRDYKRSGKAQTTTAGSIVKEKASLNTRMTTAI